MVGLTGFEPATPCTPCRCATRLRYNPFWHFMSILFRAAREGGDVYIVKIWYWQETFFMAQTFPS